MEKWANQERVYIQICTLTKIFLIRKTFGSGALYGKMLLVRIVENNKINAYFRAG